MASAYRNFWKRRKRNWNPNCGPTCWNAIGTNFYCCTRNAMRLFTRRWNDWSDSSVLPKKCTAKPSSRMPVWMTLKFELMKKPSGWIGSIRGTP